MSGAWLKPYVQHHNFHVEDRVVHVPSGRVGIVTDARRYSLSVDFDDGTFGAYAHHDLRRATFCAECGGLNPQSGSWMLTGTRDEWCSYACQTKTLAEIDATP